MAQVSTPSGNATLPVAGQDMVAEPITGWINALRAFCNEAGNIDEANVDLTGDDGIVGKSTTQTITGTKTFDAQVVLTGSYDKPLRIGTVRIWDDTTTGCTRMKRGAPSSITDGSIIVEG